MEVRDLVRLRTKEGYFGDSLMMVMLKDLAIKLGLRPEYKYPIKEMPKAKHPGNVPAPMNQPFPDPFQDKR